MYQLSQTQNPIASRIDSRRSDEAIKKILSDGTPRWLSHPQEFKQWAIECYERDKEESDRQALAYRLEEQETLSDEKVRMVHPMHVDTFLRKLRTNGVKCFIYQIPPGPNTPPAMLNTVGLWAHVLCQSNIGHEYKGVHHQYMTYMDVPFMYEWSVLRLDPHQLPNGEKYRGWRTVLNKLVTRKVLTEMKAHQIFGEPSGATSKIYKRTLYDFRNGRIKLNERQIELNA